MLYPPALTLLLDSNETSLPELIYLETSNCLPSVSMLEIHVGTLFLCWNFRHTFHFSCWNFMLVLKIPVFRYVGNLCRNYIFMLEMLTYFLISMLEIPTYQYILGVLGDFSLNKMHKVACGHKVRILPSTPL